MYFGISLKLGEVWYCPISWLMNGSRAPASAAEYVCDVPGTPERMYPARLSARAYEPRPSPSGPGAM